MYNPKLVFRIFSLLNTFFGDLHWWPGNTRFEVITGAILTQNTTWKNVEKAIQSLKKHKVLNLSAMRKLDRKKLAVLIHSTGYYNEKSKKIKTFVKFIDREFKGNLNRMAHYPALPLRSKLLGVNGIGPETADSILLYAFNKPFFVIDAYTCRIFKRLGILTGNESYDETRHMFESSIKDNLKTDAKHKSFVRVYNQYHACIVNLGKDFCTKRNPKCRICPLYRIRRCTI